MKPAIIVISAAALAVGIVAIGNRIAMGRRVLGT